MYKVYCISRFTKSSQLHEARDWSGIVGVMRIMIMVLLLSSCKDNKIKSDGSSKESSIPESNLAMVAELNSLAKHADPVNNYMLNEERAAYYYGNYKKIRNNDSLANQLYGLYLEELINAGFLDKAIGDLESHLEIKERPLVTAKNKKLYELLALAYIQHGEENNCIENHNAKSCIIPIEEEAIHQDATAADKAITIFLHLLKSFPGDLQSRWLMNLAYMTKGEYPNGVPEEYLIPLGYGKQELVLPNFSNNAMLLGIASKGLAGGVVTEDFNNDGYLDIMVSSYGLTDQLRFFKNTGNNGFKDITERAGLKGLVGGLNLVQADYNNDGFEDVFVLRGAWLGSHGKFPNSLLRNNGNDTFTDVTKEVGLLSRYPTQTATWADYNKDGHLDLFIGNESTDVPYPCELYMNTGKGTFKEVAQKVGINVVGVIKGSAWGDINNDGLPDLYLSDLNGENKLFLNKGGTTVEDWRFIEIAKISGVQEPYYSFPVWFWDFNNDGFEDIFVSGYQISKQDRAAEDEAMALLGKPVLSATPRLYRNNGNNTFSDVSKETGVNWPLYTMGCNYGDLDNDGYLDFYLGTGTPNLNSIIPNRMFKNNNGEAFDDITFQGGFGHIQKGHGVAFADMDNDGDQDIYQVLGGAVSGDTFQNMFLQNEGSSNNWITVSLKGFDSNASAIGARIKVTVMTTEGKERNIYATVSSGGSFGAASLQQEIGLGKIKEIKELKIRWPDMENSLSVFTKVPHDQFIFIDQKFNKIETSQRTRLDFDLQ